MVEIVIDIATAQSPLLQTITPEWKEFLTKRYPQLGEMFPKLFEHAPRPPAAAPDHRPPASVKPPLPPLPQPKPPVAKPPLPPLPVAAQKEDADKKAEVDDDAAQYKADLAKFNKEYAAKLARKLSPAEQAAKEQEKKSIRFPVVPGEERIPFERELMSKGGEGDWKSTGWVIEGYWASHPNPAHDKYKGAFPFPFAHARPWSGKQEFLEKLMEIESRAEEQNISKGLEYFKKLRLVHISMHGQAQSRLEYGEKIASGEYRDQLIKIAWPEDYSAYYVEQFNVIPSREFYRYVMNFEL